jgi:AraC family transcriptional regulator
MNVEIKELPAMRLAAVQHKGPYNQIGQAFGRLHQAAGPSGLLKEGETKMIGVYHDDPKSTPADQLRSEAGITVDDAATLPEGLTEVRIPAGRYGRTSHVGPYTGLPDAWAQLMSSWLPKSGQQLDGSRPSLEIYVNTEMDKPEKLITDLYVPIK